MQAASEMARKRLERQFSRESISVNICILFFTPFKDKSLRPVVVSPDGRQF